MYKVVFVSIAKYVRLSNMVNKRYVFTSQFWRYQVMVLALA